ncbi:MAG TPA: hypothetical protein VH138_17870 [Vicinamibacterales bacterium]|nr:hypothetical protein [Vicinamibacterales bacterium]
MTANERRRAWLTTLTVFAVCTAAVHADVTVVQTTTIEGGMAAMAGQSMSPKTTSRIKGKKARSDIDAQMLQMSTIADLDANQVILLRPDQKTAQVITPSNGASAGTAAAAAAAPAIDSSVKPTGKSQVIDGIKCDEYTFTLSMNMGEMNPGGQMPPDALEAMKGVKMNMSGSLWVAKDVPGAGEYIAFQKAAASTDLSSIMSGASGMMPGMAKMMKAMGSVNGMAYMSEMTMTIEGTGQIAEMMQQMGPMKITTKVTSINTDPISDDLFKIPDGYSIIKQ